MALYRDPVKGLIFRSGALATSEDCCCLLEGAMCICEDGLDFDPGCYENVTAELAEEEGGIYLGDGTKCSDAIGISCGDDPGPCNPEDTCDAPFNCLSQFYRIRETGYNASYGFGTICDIPPGVNILWQGYVGYMTLEFLCNGVWTTMETWTTSPISPNHLFNSNYKVNCTDCP